MSPTEKPPSVFVEPALTKRATIAAKNAIGIMILEYFIFGVSNS